MINILSAIGIIASIAYLLILTLGLYLCKKNKFTEGFYFFLFLIIFQISSYFLPNFIGKLIDYYQGNKSQVPIGMTIGEFVAFLSYIGLIIKSLPFFILVIGLYRRWKPESKNSSHTF
ncbi:hypothetical protein E0485_05755 [Paenibacillus albiflavus]|uniref:Uncharacterized protein n=1 Tax=Paenibacillus albiflavus TaxID=2545760 RepID=A0A4R4ELX7_9BACL|nr:hypothetical protein [Paenibacillus albiflavus]TCZ79365.1 hypothetical protein E0485_05755 [Paenibacillus albiflavus]